MHNLPIVNTHKLVQSVDLSFARYMFYKDNKIEIGMDNYENLFIRNNKFEKKYGITKKALLEKYNYNKYLEEKNEFGGLKWLDYMTWV